MAGLSPRHTASFIQKFSKYCKVYCLNHLGPWSDFILISNSVCFFQSIHIQHACYFNPDILFKQTKQTLVGLSFNTKRNSSVSGFDSLMFIVYQGNSLSHGMCLVLMIIMKAPRRYTQSDYMFLLDASLHSYAA